MAKYNFELKKKIVLEHLSLGVGVVYYSFEELKSEIERYIKYYNEQRIKEKLGWMSPVQYRLSLLAA